MAGTNPTHFQHCISAVRRKEGEERDYHESKPYRPIPLLKRVYLKSCGVQECRRRSGSSA